MDGAFNSSIKAVVDRADFLERNTDHIRPEDLIAIMLGAINAERYGLIGDATYLRKVGPEIARKWAGL